MQGNTFVGKVVSVKDTLAAGIIQVVNPSINGGSPISCYASSPTGGGGAGFFSVPGLHSNVLVTKVNIDDSDCIWVWTASVYLPSVNAVGIDGTPVSLGKVKSSNTEGFGTRQPADEAGYMSHDNPFPVDIYQDNNTPQGEVWVSKTGHSLQFFGKCTSERCKDGVALKSKLGKALIIEDSAAGGFNGFLPDTFPDVINYSKSEKINGSRIMLTDENGNRLQIRHGDVSLIAKNNINIKSGQHINIAAKNGVTVTSNYGSIDISTKGLTVKTIVDKQPFTINLDVLINGLPVVTYG